MEIEAARLGGIEDGSGRWLVAVEELQGDGPEQGVVRLLVEGRLQQLARPAAGLRGFHQLEDAILPRQLVADDIAELAVSAADDALERNLARKRSAERRFEVLLLLPVQLQ